MDERAGRVLDYANPLAFLRATARPASVSQVVRSAGAGWVRFTEWPLGRESALLGIGFSLICAAILGGATFPYLKFSWSHFQRDLLNYVVLTIVWVAEAVVLGMVVARNWRQTVLELRDGRFRLSTPAGTTVWSPPETEELDYYVTGRTRDGVPLAEVQIRLSGIPTFRLFIDHPEREIAVIVHELRTASGLGPRPPEGESHLRNG